MDPFARVFDLHAAFTPEGTGREAAQALREALERVDFDACFVFEVEDEPNSRPPKSVGFRLTSPETDGGWEMRLWVLTREAWEASPVRRRMH